MITLKFLEVIKNDIFNFVKILIFINPTILSFIYYLYFNYTNIVDK